ncbi:MAG: hypothetical protein MI864_19530 [Pseudomonadales bacterium]|nr:hypothetical protein [Pseudomonadales bacterium]
MKRLYFATSTLGCVDDVMTDLHQQGLSDWRLHTLTSNEAGLYTHHIHSANVLYKSDVVRYLERGAIVGLTAALFTLIPLNLSGVLEVSLLGTVGICAFFMLIGGWIGGIGGISKENYKLKRFHNRIEKGQYLMMIDVPKHDLNSIKQTIIAGHPAAQFLGVDSTLTNPFVEEDGRFHLA